MALVLAAALTLLLAAGSAACSSSDTSSAAETDAAPMQKVTVAGDSISVGLGAALRGVVDSAVDVKVIGEEGSGLARPDVFDWPARLQELARDFPPTVLVLSLGSNDAQDLTDAAGTVVVTMADEAAWDDEYRRRLAVSFDAFADSDVQVVWVGHVRTTDDVVADTNRRIHELAVEVAADRDWVTVEDLADLLGTGEGEASQCLVEDGLHLTSECLSEAAEQLGPRLPLG
jgi:lysophospholipase L1-like esterase